MSQLRPLIILLVLFAVACDQAPRPEPAQLPTIDDVVKKESPAVDEAGCASPACESACSGFAEATKEDCAAAFVAGCFGDSPPTDFPCGDFVNAKPQPAERQDMVKRRAAEEEGNALKGIALPERKAEEAVQDSVGESQPEVKAKRKSIEPESDPAAKATPLGD